MRKFFFLIIITVFLIPTTYASEDSAYDFSWLDPDKEVYVLQNRKFRKARRVHFVGGAGITTSGAFVDSMNYQGRIGYFPVEEWGFEFLYSKNNGKENDAAASVRDNGNGTGTTPFRRVVESYMGGLLLWSPFYSKINTFNKIIYLDVIFGAGYGKLEEKNNREEFLDGSVQDFEDAKESHNAFMWDVALQFYLSTHWSTRVDLTALHYQAKKASVDEDNWYNNYDLTLSIGYNF